MITKQQFDKLLKMTMLDLNDSEYSLIFSQMDTITGFYDTLDKIQLDGHNVNVSGAVTLDRDYSIIPTNIQENTQHPMVNNMIQIKFKRTL